MSRPPPPFSFVDINPSGALTSGTWEFFADGGFSTTGAEGFRMTGRYQRSDDRIALIATSVSNDREILPADAPMDIAVTKLTADQLEFDIVVRRSGNRRTSACTREKEAEKPG